MRKLFYFLPIFLLILSSCEKENEDEIKITKSELKGLVQKGPFLNGTSIDIYELGDNLSPTGKTFSSQIVDNSGLFELNNISLISEFVQLKANGYYFNEITGDNSGSPIILYAISDITDKTTVNVNVLTHLEKSRIEYLLANGATSFSTAKKQAEEEILAIFSIVKLGVIDFETLDISIDEESNAILLAISLITQGYRTESEFSDLLANIATDIREDGELNSSSLGSLLINDARLLNLSQIRSNLESRYDNLGQTVTIPNFEKYIQLFIDSTSFVPSNSIEYPEFSNYGENVLYGDKTSFNSGLSLSANLPKGTSLKIVIKGGIWYYRVMPNGPINWTISDYSNEQQTFVVTESGKSCDLSIEFDSGTHTIEYYENNSLTPTKTKIYQN